VLYGTQLSPFALKLALALRASGRRFRWSWQLGVLRGHAQYEARKALASAGLLRWHVPRQRSPLDELPLVPFLFGEDGSNCVDSSAIVAELALDAALPAPAAFVSLLVEELFDEVGLYLVHHHRWTQRANLDAWRGAEEQRASPGAYLFREEKYRGVPMPEALRAHLVSWFNARQRRRLPYFLSTHETRAALDQWLERTVDAVELVLADPAVARAPLDEQSLLWALGARAPCAADASCFGQLNMLAHLNRGSRDEISLRAPRTVGWLDAHQLAVQAHTGQPVSPLAATPRALPPAPMPTPTPSARAGDARAGLAGLLSLARDLFVPLMKANEAAYEAYAGGEEGRWPAQQLFNEQAMWRHEALFETRLLGTSVTSVAKTFQVPVWRRVKAAWSALAPEHRACVEALGCEGLGEAILGPPPRLSLLSRNAPPGPRL
jgi:hypothetical protein